MLKKTKKQLTKIRKEILPSIFSHRYYSNQLDILKKKINQQTSITNDLHMIVEVKRKDTESATSELKLVSELQKEVLRAQLLGDKDLTNEAKRVAKLVDDTKRKSKRVLKIYIDASDKYAESSNKTEKMYDQYFRIVDRSTLPMIMSGILINVVVLAFALCVFLTDSSSTNLLRPEIYAVLAQIYPVFLLAIALERTLQQDKKQDKLINIQKYDRASKTSVFFVLLGGMTISLFAVASGLNNLFIQSATISYGGITLLTLIFTYYDDFI